MGAADAPTFASLQPWAQAIAAILIVVGGALVALSGWLKGKPKPTGGMAEQDVVEALKHLRWISRHAERQADAAEEANRLAERHIAALEKLATKARAPPTRSRT